MIQERTPRLSRRAAAIRALTVSLSLTVFLPGALRRRKPPRLHRPSPPFIPTRAPQPTIPV